MENNSVIYTSRLELKLGWKKGNKNFDTWTSRKLERWEMYTKFWLYKLKRRGHAEHMGVDGRIILE
jgi:hypothetical protein